MTLRPMLMSDADFMLELKNDPRTREFAIKSHDEIKKEDHYKWLEKNIDHFKIIEGETHRLGAIRIQGWEISIWIAKEFRGLGIASKAIEKVRQPFMTAKIVEGNVGSMRAFINAGFLPAMHVSNYYVFQYL